MKIKFNVEKQKKILIIAVILSIFSFSTFVYAASGPVHSLNNPISFVNFEKHKNKAIESLDKEIEKLEKEQEKVSPQNIISFQARSVGVQEATISNESSDMEDINTLKDKIMADIDPATLKEDLKAFHNLEHEIHKNMHLNK
jgi:hypothetical protein